MGMNYQNQKIFLLNVIAPTIFFPLISSIIVNVLNLNFMGMESGGIVLNYIDGLIFFGLAYLALGIIYYLMIINLKAKREKIIATIIFWTVIAVLLLYTTFLA